jgi:hypothetical protein
VRLECLALYLGTNPVTLVSLQRCHEEIAALKKLATSDCLTIALLASNNLSVAFRNFVTGTLFSIQFLHKI